jgi:hypothetical protein
MVAEAWLDGITLTQLGPDSFQLNSPVLFCRSSTCARNAEQTFVLGAMAHCGDIDGRCFFARTLFGVTGRS